MTVTKRVIYLSGGLNGKNLKEAAALFNKYEEQYLAAGFQVYNPVKLDNGAHGNIDDVGTLRPTEEQWREFMARDLGIILRARIDRLYMLPGWTHSRGARLEVLVAQFLNIPVYNAETGKVISDAKKKAKAAHV